MTPSNLPPGCTNADIERAFGDQPLLDELFEAQGGLTDEEKALWAEVCSMDQKKFDLLIKALEWALSLGYSECQGHDEEARFYESMHHQEARNPKLRQYFRALRQRGTK